MIEFQGDIKESIKRKFFAWQERMLTYLFCSVYFIGGIPVATYFSAILHAWYLLGIIAGFLFLLFFGCLALTKRKVPQKDFDKFFPTLVRISSKGLALQGKEFDQTRDMADVKKVYDYGEYYFITFYFPAKSQQFICEKDLLVSGTIEEFEDLFAGKIVRKKTKAKTVR